MSEPRHVWMTPTGHTGVYIEVTPDYPGAMRRTLTEGPEWSALMERARDAMMTDSTGEVLYAAMRDILAYMGEQP